MPMNLFSNHRYCRILCACVCLCVLMGLFKSCPIYIATPHYPYCLHYCPEVRCSFPHWALSSRWPNMPQDGRQADMLGENGLFALSLLYWGHRMLAGALGLGWFQTAARFPVSKQLISFFNTQLPQHQAQVKVTSLVCWSASSIGIAINAVLLNKPNFDLCFRVCVFWHFTAVELKSLQQMLLRLN